MLLSALLLASTLAPQAHSAADAMAAVRTVLLRGPSARAARDEELIQRLSALGTDAIGPLFDLVAGQGLERLIGDRDPKEWHRHPEEFDDLALASLAALSQEKVRGVLAQRCAEDAPREVRIAALTVLGTQGSSRGMALFLSICARSGIELEMRCLREPARAALSGMLVHDPKTLGVLEQSLASASLPVCSLACEALSLDERVAAVELLARLLGRSPELDARVVEGLTQLGERRPWSLAAPAAEHLRREFERGAGTRAGAAHGLGRLRDALSVPSLIAGLSQDDVGLERVLQWSLTQITGERNLRSPEDWNAWLKQEHAWWNTEGQAQLEALRSGSPERLAPALRELERHPIGRERAGQALVAGLGLLPSGARALACEGLVRLRARRSVSGLIPLLDDPEENVRAAAARALAALTGMELPPLAQAWKDSLST